MTGRDRTLLTAIAVIGALGAFWFLALSPKRKDANDLKAKVVAAEQRLSEAQSRATQAQAAKAGYNRDYATFARLGKAVPAIADEPSLIYQLEIAARKAKVDFRSVTIEDAAAAAPGSEADSAPSGGVTPRPFKLTFEGNYASLRRLLESVGGFVEAKKGSGLTTSGRLLTLDGVNLVAGRKGLPQVKAEIDAKAYVAAAAPTSGAASTAPGAAPAGTTPTTPAAPGATASGGQTASTTP